MKQEKQFDLKEKLKYKEYLTKAKGNGYIIEDYELYRYREKIDTIWILLTMFLLFILGILCGQVSLYTQLFM